MSSGTMKGQGFFTGQAVSTNGEMLLRVMGRDNISGAWTAFEVVIPWSVWETLNERAYDDREDQAQQRIC